MVDLLHQAVLIGGLEQWRYENAEGAVISEPRLRDRLARMDKFKDLRHEGAFRAPPAGDDKEPTRAQGILALEFPSWFTCQGCRRLLKASDFVVDRPGNYIHECDDRRRSPCVPVRFVLACRHGHLEDFRWMTFVHEGQHLPRCAAPSLKLLEGPSGDIAEVRVVCVCGAARNLVSAYAPGSTGSCDGKRPWLTTPNQPCDERLHLLVRSASNGYFAQIVSALSIPDPNRALRDALSTHWTKLQSVEELADLRVIRRQTGHDLKPYTDEQLWAAMQDFKAEKPEMPPLRSSEYQQLVRSPVENAGDQPAPQDAFFARALPRLDARFPHVGRVALVHRLREVRAQVGFTRLEAPVADLEGEFDLDVSSAAISEKGDWLPATVVNGEGLFLQLDEDAVTAWEKRPKVVDRAAALEAGFGTWLRQRFDDTEQARAQHLFPGIRYYLLHSLSHLLMTALSLECGYGATALAERIYCSRPGAPEGMAAILISTGTPGAEGTLGGLVEQGRHWPRHLRRALRLGRLCSHDPVCAAHVPEKHDRSERYLEGAACHGCLFTAECSCERFNQFLDRVLVVPSLGHQELAFFDLPSGP